MQVNLRQNRDMHKKGGMIELLEENIEGLHDFGVGKECLSRTQKLLTIKEKNEKRDVIKIKNICLLKDTSKRVKEKSQTWRRYLQYRYLTKGPF